MVFITKQKSVLYMGSDEKCALCDDKIVDQVLDSPDLGKELEKVNKSPHNLFAKSIYNYDMKEVIEHYISLESDEIDYIKKTISGI